MGQGHIIVAALVALGRVRHSRDARDELKRAFSGPSPLRRSHYTAICPGRGHKV